MVRRPLARAVLLAGTALAAADPGADLAAAAHRQVGVTVHYDGRYRRIPYPGGDVPPDRGVCTDVLVRAYRALGIDLQARVHQDLVAAWSHYPRHGGQAAPDPNIDHRRVPNLAAFFRRHGRTLPATTDPALYRPGDIVVWRLASGLPHIGLVAAQRDPSGRPLVLHNIGAGVQLEDRLFAYTLTGHYRYPP